VLEGLIYKSASIIEEFEHDMFKEAFVSNIVSMY
jgi:hypothetical protein